MTRLGVARWPSSTAGFLSTIGLGAALGGLPGRMLVAMAAVSTLLGMIFRKIRFSGLGQFRQ